MKLSLAIIALLLAGPAVAGVDSLPDSELCTDYAATLLTGHSYRAGMFHVYNQAELEGEAKARSLTCEPMDHYFEIARYRLGQQARRADAMSNMYQQQQRYYQQQQLQQQQQQQMQRRTPIQTTCTQIGNTTSCTSSGG